MWLIWLLLRSLLHRSSTKRTPELLAAPALPLQAGRCKPMPAAMLATRHLRMQGRRKADAAWLLQPSPLHRSENTQGLSCMHVLAPAAKAEQRSSRRAHWRSLDIKRHIGCTCVQVPVHTDDTS